MPFSIKPLLCGVVGVFSVHQGPLQIDHDGAVVDLHVVALSEKGKIFNTSGRTLKMKWGGETRAFLAKKKTDEMPADNYYNFTLLNRELSYDIDLGAVGCSCNAALFFVSMPGHHQDGTLAHGDLNPYYCDANKVGGVWCWEHDTIEGNMYTMATTPHTCNAPPGQYIDSCHKRGCQTNAFEVDPNGMCPDASCTIDTRRPFRIVQRYNANPEGTLLTQISNRLVQGNSTFAWDSCQDPAYLGQMTAAFSSNMSMVFQLWGDEYSTMAWLDDMVGCSGKCVAHEAEVTFSNIAIEPLVPTTEETMIVV